MSSIQLHRILGILGAAAAITATPAQLFPQGQQDTILVLTRLRTGNAESSEYAQKTVPSFKSRADSISWARYKAVADASTGYRLVVSLQDHHLWAIIGIDTVLSAPVGTASGKTLEYNGRRFDFDMPRGVRTVLAKEAGPIWQPPEWLYVETAKEYNLQLGHISNGSKIKISDGRFIAVRDGEVGLIDSGTFAALPTDEHIVFDNTLYVPPLGTKNRMVDGALGKYRLNLGDGFLLHGTPYKDSIGYASTHGCVRMRDQDIEWLYELVPVGTKVYIY